MTELDCLAPGSSLEPLIAWTRLQTEGDCAWVGHNPDVGRLAASLIGEPRLALHFAKGAIAAIDFDHEIAAGKGQLRWLITADLLDCCGSTRPHPQRPVQPDHAAVEHRVLDHVLDEGGEFLGPPEA